MNFVGQIPESIPTKEPDTFPIDNEIAVCNQEEFTKLLYGFKQRYGYDEWIKVGSICFNNFAGADIGFDLWYEKWTSSNIISPLS